MPQRFSFLRSAFQKLQLPGPSKIAVAGFVKNWISFRGFAASRDRFEVGAVIGLL